MILQTLELSPSQKAAIEEVVGRELQNQENIVVCGGVPKVASAPERQAATEQMRYQLYMLDRSQHRVSIEDYIADVLDEPVIEVPV